jgi:hypothetical protein
MRWRGKWACSSYPERHGHNGRSEVVNRLIVKSSIIARNFSPAIIGSSKKKGLMMFFITMHHMLTLGESQSCFMRVFTPPYTEVVPADCSMHMEHCFIRKTSFVEARLVLFQCRKAFLKHTIFSDLF